MNFLRTLSIRDSGAALKRRQFFLAQQISHNLFRNAVGHARFNVVVRASPQSKCAVRGVA